MQFTQEAPAQELVVGVSDLKESGKANTIITTYALGSCLGITCYDPFAKVGGMLHAMLPTSKLHAQPRPEVAMFIDTGVPELVQRVLKLGGNPRVMEFKVFGGAKVLQADEYFSIGNKNIKMMETIATQMRLYVKLWEVGGQLNRTIKFHLKDGRVKLRMPNQPETFV